MLRTFPFRRQAVLLAETFTEQYFDVLYVYKNWWVSSVYTECVWRKELFYSTLEQRVDILQLFTVLD